MAVKELLVRVQHKRDISANWEAQDPVLLNGEIIIVDTTDGKTRTKTGDGQKRYSQLPFDDETMIIHPYLKIFSSSEWIDGTLTISALEHKQCIDNGFVLAKTYMLSDGVYLDSCLAAMDTTVSVDDDKNVILSYNGPAYDGKVIFIPISTNIAPYVKIFDNSDWRNGTLTISASEHKQLLAHDVVLSKIYKLINGVYSDQCLAVMDTTVFVSDDKSVILSYGGVPYDGKVVLIG